MTSPSLERWLCADACLDESIIPKTLATLEANEVFTVNDLVHLENASLFESCFSPVTASKIREAMRRAAITIAGGDAVSRDIGGDVVGEAGAVGGDEGEKGEAGAIVVYDQRGKRESLVGKRKREPLAADASAVQKPRGSAGGSARRGSGQPLGYNRAGEAIPREYNGVKLHLFSGSQTGYDKVSVAGSKFAVRKLVHKNGKNLQISIGPGGFDITHNKAAYGTGSFETAVAAAYAFALYEAGATA